MKRNKIIRFWIVVLLLLVVEALALSAGWWAPRLFPRCYVSDLYRRYEHADGIRASFLKDYPVNDTLRLDVTLLEATTDAGWDRLKTNFNILELVPVQQEMLKKNHAYVSTRRVPRNAPGQTIDKTNPDNNIIRVTDYANHAIAFFHTNNDQENSAVLFYTITNKNFKQ